MKTCFVTQSSDAVAVCALEYLKNKGHTTFVLTALENAPIDAVALFTAENTANFRNRYVSVCPHKFIQRNIVVPGWVESTPFQVAIHQGALAMRKWGFEHALDQIAQTYSVWNPYADPVAPWNPLWNRGHVPAKFHEWHKHAQLRVLPPEVEERVGRYLTPVFTPSKITKTSTLMVIGCAAFNKPHTDLVDELLPAKMEVVVRNLAALVDCGNFERVEVVIPEGDILSNSLLRSHLHPFMFMSVQEAECLIGEVFAEKTRLWNRSHRRNDYEIAEAFNASAIAMRRQLIEPLAKKVRASVVGVSWVGIIHSYLEEADAIVKQHTGLIEATYLERVRTRPSYALLHRIDPDAGIKRTIGNAVLYVAEAMYLRDHDNCILANFEANDVYWHGLEAVIRPLWGDRTPYIGMAHESCRQPWGY